MYDVRRLFWKFSKTIKEVRSIKNQASSTRKKRLVSKETVDIVSVSWGVKFKNWVLYYQLSLLKIILFLILKEHCL